MTVVFMHLFRRSPAAKGEAVTPNATTGFAHVFGKSKSAAPHRTGKYAQVFASGSARSIPARSPKSPTLTGKA